MPIRKGSKEHATGALSLPDGSTISPQRGSSKSRKAASVATESISEPASPADPIQVDMAADPGVEAKPAKPAGVVFLDPAEQPPPERALYTITIPGVPQGERVPLPAGAMAEPLQAAAQALADLIALKRPSGWQAMMEIITETAGEAAKLSSWDYAGGIVHVAKQPPPPRPVQSILDITAGSPFAPGKEP